MNMSKYFARIIFSGYDNKGKTVYKIYLYKRVENLKDKNEYNYLDVDTMKRLNMGTIYKEGHYIRTNFYDKEWIIRILKSVWHKNISYIFE
jgi:hypothetical protein